MYDSLQIKWWDIWMGLMLLFTAMVTPYQVAFLTPSLGSASWCLWLVLPAAWCLLLRRRCSEALKSWVVASLHYNLTGDMVVRLLSGAGLFFWNLVVDASFLVDLGLQPFLGYWNEEKDVWGVGMCLCPPAVTLLPHVVFSSFNSICALAAIDFRLFARVFAPVNRYFCLPCHSDGSGSHPSTLPAELGGR